MAHGLCGTKQVNSYCKTQNSGLRSKEEKPRDPINQPSRCNAQEGLLSVAQTGDSDLLGGRAHPEQQIGQAFYMLKKKYYQHITYGLQSDWLHVCKAILLVQTSRATCLQSNPIGTNFAGLGSNLKQFYWYKRCGLLFKLRQPLAFQLSRFYWVHIDWLAPGHPMGAGNPAISRETETQVLAACQPAPHNKTYFSASKTNKKNIRHMNYRHW